MEMEAAVEKVCRGCLESNLTEEVRLSRCGKCGQRYCLHFASNIDPQFCTDCLSDVSMHKETVIKTYQPVDVETGEPVGEPYRRKAKSIRLEGMDWLFACRKIHTLSDDALELAIEYHREILQGMLLEREERRIKQAHRYANVQYDTSKTVSTEVKKTKSISSTKAAANANGAIQALLASGKSIEEIMKMLGG